MRKISEIKIGENKVIVRELTVAQVESCFDQQENVKETSALDWLFADEYMPENILEMIIDRPVAEVMPEDMAPSELEPLYKEALRINPFLGKALARMRKISEQMMSMDLQKLLYGSGAAPYTSSTEDSMESGTTDSPSSSTQSTSSPEKNNG